MPPECPTCLAHHASTERCTRRPREVRAERQRRTRDEVARLRAALHFIATANPRHDAESLRGIAQRALDNK